ncbi:D-methionine transport system substrate-binding protein [Breoghania corrubedonensis]|uniref:D-methionine transport system substrate-binding protein n=1 Tax=Breoghania corrubedonensis TaxID=665038 RepID=A0A2T5US50_9HYPH|nr:MetQ/NlpA family ABC transporter substrate-binding protein [Breoghania corrubedonensis]PTW54337.1 D-methionine transport system substrate-binding protein [Breoghania corrubedonensis]
MKRLTTVVSVAAALLSAGYAHAETKKVGVTTGPHAQIVEKVKEVAATKGLDLDVIEFTDYVMPNQALADGDLDINSFQHQPYLDNQVADRGFDLVSVAKSVNFPMAGYSNKVKSKDEIPDGATFALPNDPSNGGRALLMLEDQGLIKLTKDIGVRATVANVIDNPHDYQFIELDAAQLPRSLDDVDVALINTNYALDAGLNPVEDSLFRESTKAPYVGIIAVRSKDKDAAWVKTFVESYHSPEVKAFIEKQFKGAITPTW